VVHKGTHPGVECYSAFGDPWGLITMELPSLLAAKEITDVFVVGLAGDYCVKSTAIDAAIEDHIRVRDQATDLGGERSRQECWK
jgi:nicotinamidase-related amidase